MKIWDPQSIQFFLLLFVPGFIVFKISDLLLPGERRDFIKAIPEAVSYSAINFAFFYLLYQLFPDQYFQDHPNIYIGSWFFVLLIAPVIWAFIWRSVYQSDWFKNTFRNLMSSSWDFFFNKKQVCWIIIHLKDGSKIAGKFDSKSFATSFPHPPQIYLEEVWELDESGGFDKAVEQSMGMVVFGDEIRAIEFKQ